jgi:peptide deformylase
VSLTLVQAGDPVLRQPARRLESREVQSAAMHKLIDEMRQAMYEAPGVGLAAPQIGLGLQLAVIEDREEYSKEISPEQLAQRERRPVAFHAIINPVLQFVGGETAEFFEGCLSLTGMMALVPRARTVRVECLDELGKPRVIEASGWYARILQHEIDHLQGTLYIDRMRSRTLTSLENWQRFWKDKPIAEIRTALQA